MRTSLLLSLMLVTVAGCGGTSDAGSTSTTASPVSYRISFANREHHEAEIRVTFTDLSDEPLQLRMSRTSPGRYALHEFAKNVYNVRATGLDGRAVEVSRPNPHQWDVSGHGGEVMVTYTLYGDRADGTYTGIDRTHAHLNMPATFMFARRLGERPVELTVEIPEGSGWRVATQLRPTDDPGRFSAPDMAYFMDSPTEVSDHWTTEWQRGDQTIRIALHHQGTEEEARRYAEAVQAIVATSEEVYGLAPDFDFGTYTFLACYLPWVSGDGMEHRNSTILTSTGNLAENMTGLLGTVAHEFFHAWNIERIRPATLEPFDFEAANMSRELWFGEGFTSYYDDLILWRAGLISDEAFGQRMGGIANAVTNARGRRFFSPVEMSMQAPFVDAATSVDPTNRINTFLSYYTWGSGVGMALDLTLRERFPGVTLDDVMRGMWETHGAPEVPYEVNDIESALAAVTGDDAFAADFFDRFVRGREAPDFAALLTPAGIVVERASPDAAWLGDPPLSFADGAAVLLVTPRLETPLYAAGADRGDRIVSIDGVALDGADAVERLLGTRAPGDSVLIRYQSRGDDFETTVPLAEDPTLAGRWLPEDSLTAEQARRRAAWR